MSAQAQAQAHGVGGAFREHVCVVEVALDAEAAHEATRAVLGEVGYARRVRGRPGRRRLQAWCPLPESSKRPARRGGPALRVLSHQVRVTFAPHGDDATRVRVASRQAQGALRFATAEETLAERRTQVRRLAEELARRGHGRVVDEHVGDRVWW